MKHPGHFGSVLCGLAGQDCIGTNKTCLQHQRITQCRKHGAKKRSTARRPSLSDVRRPLQGGILAKLDHDTNRDVRRAQQKFIDSQSNLVPNWFELPHDHAYSRSRRLRPGDAPTERHRCMARQSIASRKQASARPASRSRRRPMKSLTRLPGPRPVAFSIARAGCDRHGSARLPSLRVPSPTCSTTAGFHF